MWAECCEHLNNGEVYTIQQLNNAGPDVELSQEGSACFTYATNIQLDKTEPTTTDQ